MLISQTSEIICDSLYTRITTVQKSTQLQLYRYSQLCFDDCASLMQGVSSPSMFRQAEDISSAPGYTYTFVLSCKQPSSCNFRVTLTWKIERHSGVYPLYGNMKNTSGSVSMLVPSNLVHVKGLLSNSKLLSMSLLNMPYRSEPMERNEKSETKKE